MPRKKPASIKSRKTEPSKMDFNDEDAVLFSVARAIDIDPDMLTISEDRGLSGFGAGTVYEITIRGGNKEWQVVENADQERELAIAVVTQDLEEDPSMFEKNFIESHIDMHRLKRDLEPDVLESNESRLRDERASDFWKEYERAGFDAPEEDEDGERPDPENSEIEELAQHQTDEELRDPMRYLGDIYSPEEAIEKAIEIAGINVSAAAEEAVDTDGPEHFLARYDGASHETDSGFVYWRSN